jgi:hypothetical protein
LPDVGAAIEEERGGIEGVAGFVVFLGVGDADVFLGCLEEFVAELVFELGAGPVDVVLF